MKYLFLSLFILLTSKTFAYDERLIRNIEKADSLLARAQDEGITPSGAECSAELKRSEDGHTSLLLHTEEDDLYIGLDIAPYGRIKSSWTKRSFELHTEGCFGSEAISMKEDFATRKLVVKAKADTLGKITEETCLLPLR